MTITSRLVVGLLLLALSVSTFAGSSNFTAPTLPVAQNNLVNQLHPTLECHRRSVAYRPAYYSGYRRRNTKLRTALTIAAPAALGAGIGALAGGKRGALGGALIGGGSGALYHLFKSRPRY